MPPWPGPAQPLRKQAQVALDLTLLLHGADAKENDQIYRSQAKRGTCSFYAYASAYIVHKGRRTVALQWRSPASRRWRT